MVCLLLPVILDLLVSVPESKSAVVVRLGNDVRLALSILFKLRLG